MTEPLPASDEPTRFFFVHVLKTGGTDLFTRLGGDPAIPLDHQRDFSEAQLYPNDTDGNVITVAPQLSVDQLLLRWAARRDEIRVVMGHFPLCTVELLDAPFTTLTVLREPVERTLSFLRHHKRMTKEDRHKDMEEIYDDPFRFHGLIHNHMVKMFALGVDEMTDGMLTEMTFDRSHLELAKERLATVDVVGVQTEFESFCGELHARFGWQLGEPFFANRTEPVEVSDAFRRRIAADNELDAELFEFARGLVADRAGRPTEG